MMLLGEDLISRIPNPTDEQIRWAISGNICRRTSCSRPTLCGMTGDPLTSTHRAEFGGTTFWFCSAGCQAAFEKEPQLYLKAIEA